MIEKVISGGQTGADIAGVKAAKACGIKTGGFMPLGYKTADGLKPEYEDLYNMVAIDVADYAERTRLNVMQSDCTVRLAVNFNSRGELCTAKYIKRYAKPCYNVNLATVMGSTHNYKEKEVGLLAHWLMDNDFKIVNIAGNRETFDWPIEEFVYNFLVYTFEDVNNLTVV